MVWGGGNGGGERQGELQGQGVRGQGLETCAAVAGRVLGGVFCAV